MTEQKDFVAGAIVSLVSAALGAGATLVATELQADGAVRAEERARRADVYSTYRAAAWDYLNTEVTVISSDQCAFEATPPGGETRCAGWRPDDLVAPHNAYVQARDDLAIYGTSEVLEAADAMHKLVAPVRPPLLMLAVDVQAAGMANDPAELAAIVEEFGAAEDAYLLAMCRDVSTTPATCVAHLEPSAPTSSSTPTS